MRKCFGILFGVFLAGAAVTTPPVMGLNGNISTAKDEIESIAQQMAENRCDEAYPQIYRIGEILYRVRVNYRRDEDLDRLSRTANAETGRISALLTLFNEGMTAVDAASAALTAATLPFEQRLSRGGFAFSDDGINVSSYARAMLDANQDMIAALRKLSDASRALSGFYPETGIVLYDPQVDTQAEIMRLSLFGLSRGLRAFSNEAEYIQKNLGLHLQTLPLFLDIRRIQMAVNIYKNNDLQTGQAYVSGLKNRLDFIASDIPRLKSDINEEALNLAIEARNLFNTAQYLCSTQALRYYRLKYGIDPGDISAILKILINRNKYPIAEPVGN